MGAGLSSLGFGVTVLIRCCSCCLLFDLFFNLVYSNFFFVWPNLGDWRLTILKMVHFSRMVSWLVIFFALI